MYYFGYFLLYQRKVSDSTVQIIDNSFFYMRSGYILRFMLNRVADSMFSNDYKNISLRIITTFQNFNPQMSTQIISIKYRPQILNKTTEQHLNVYLKKKQKLLFFLDENYINVHVDQDPEGDKPKKTAQGITFIIIARKILFPISRKVAWKFQTTFIRPDKHLKINLNHIQFQIGNQQLIGQYLDQGNSAQPKTRKTKEGTSLSIISPKYRQWKSQQGGGLLQIDCGQIQNYQ